MNLWKRLTSHFTGNISSPPPASEKAPESNKGVNRPKASPSPGGEGSGEGELKSNSQPSPLDHLPSNRNGKIAHLPRALRDRINLALYNRCPAKELARALNQLPEVQAVMAQYFDGRPLKRQNIDEWKHGGYRDWLHHRQILEQKRELTADARDLSGTADGLPDSLFGMLTLDYAHLMMNGDKETPEEFEKRRKKLSLVSQDIVRIRRSDLQARRVQVQETRLERDEEKTEEQLVFKFMEWTDNPAVRRACILEPMEKNRQMRQMYNMPPRPEDPLVEQLTRHDPYFHPQARKQNKSRPKPTEKSNPASEPQGGSSIQPGVGTALPTPGSDPKEPINPEGVESPSQSTTSYGEKSSSQLASEIEENHNHAKTPHTNPTSTASEKISETNNNANQPPASGWGERTREPSLRGEGELKTDSISSLSSNPAGPLAGIASAISHVIHSCSSAVTGGKGVSNSKLSPRSTGQNPHLSAYERALLEGKTFLEALHIHSTTPVTPKPQPQGTPKPNPLDAFSQPVPSGYQHMPIINFRPNSNWRIPG
jgi:hypothetical protein